MSNLKFDRHAFECRAEPVHTEYVGGDTWESTGIDWADYGRMGTQASSRVLRNTELVPEFALNDKKLRMVILERERMHNLLKKGVWGRYAVTMNRIIRRAGSYRAMLVGVAYRAWRLGWDSPTIALEMDMSPALVRLHLYRMVQAARMLAAREWVPVVPEYVEGEICYTCRKRPVNKARCKWRCDICQDAVNMRARKEHRRRNGWTWSKEARARRSEFMRRRWARSRALGIPFRKPQNPASRNFRDGATLPKDAGKEVD